MTDVWTHLGLVDRTVGEREHEGRLARLVVASRRYSTSVDDLWDAITNPARIPRWFLPISGDLRLGGRYQLEGNAGGVITLCDPPRRLKLTWEWGADISWVDVELSSDSAGGSRLRLEHLGHVPDEFWERYGPGAGGVGWDMALFGLDQYFVTGAAVTPAEAAAWVGSAAGKAFVRGSSDEWCRASIAAGTEPAGAEAAARRTTAFYTGEAPPEA
jgi:uncharacterized protein YndB with AHSA1/START domain